MKISELLKDNSVSIELIEETRSVSQRIYGGLFGGYKEKISNEDWAGYAVVKNGNRILETFGYNRTQDYHAWSLTINGKKQSVDKDVARGIFFDIQDLYEQQEQEKRRIRIEKEKAILEQKKQVYYDMLQESLHQK